MNAHLNHIENWQDLTKEAHWSAIVMAKRRNVSTEALHRHSLVVAVKSTREWLSEDPERHALELLRGGSSAKEAKVA